jgi:hypothetical protein
MEASCLSLNLCHSFGRFQEMQNGLHTDKVANNDRVLPSGGGGSGTVHHGPQGGDGTVLPLNGDTVGDGGRGNSCASSRSERAADSGAVRHGPSGFAHKPGVEGVERRDPVQRLRHGSLSVSLTSSESGSKGRGRAHYRDQTDQSSIRTEIRAGAVSAYTTHGGEEHLSRVREGRTSHGPRGHSPQEPFDASLDQAASRGDLPSQHGVAKRRRRKRNKPKYTQNGREFYTIPARRHWATGSGPFASHHSSGHRNWRGAQRWHAWRHPVYTGSEEEVRRHFHAGRTPGPRGGRHQYSGARR